MKMFEEYMALPYRMEIIPDQEEGGYGTRYPELSGCISCGETIEAAIANLKDAKKAWLMAAMEDGVNIPEPTVEDTGKTYSGQFKLRIPRSLHKLLSEQAKREGISMNQYCMYLLSRNYVMHTA